jgi:hypothetical protein
MAAQTLINTAHFKITNVGGGATVQSVAPLIAQQLKETSAWGIALRAVLPPEYTWDALWVQRVAPIRVAKYELLIGVIGGDAEHANTANSAQVILRRGDLANRHNQGSVHLLYPNLDAGTVDGELSAGRIAALEALAGFYATGFALPDTSQIAPVLFPGGTLDVTKAVPISATSVNPRVRTMRRRTVGLGI